MPQVNSSSSNRNINEGNPLLHLPYDLLDDILSRLNLRDHVRLGATCRFLRNYALMYRLPYSKSICWVPSHNPRLLLNRFLWQHDLRFDCLGFFQGWLVITDRGPCRNAYLINRFLGERIQLPALMEGQVIIKAVLSTDPHSDECIVAILDEWLQPFICFRPGRLGARWVDVTRSEKGLRRCYLDVAVHGRRIYLVSAGRNMIIKLSLDVSERSLWWEFHPLSQAFLVVCNDMVCAAVLCPSTAWFDVWELGGTETVRRRGLGGRALLLSYYVTGSTVPAEELRMAERDFIYLLAGNDHAYAHKYDPETQQFPFVQMLQVSGSSLASYSEYIRNELTFN